MLLKIGNSIDNAYKTLEKYYDELENYNTYSNVGDYDLDITYYKNKLEKVISDSFPPTKENEEILNELLIEIDDIKVVDAIKVILNIS